MPPEWLQKLLDQGLISEDQLADAREMALEADMSLRDALLKLGFISDIGTGKGFAVAPYDREISDLDVRQIPGEVLDLIPETVARENLIIPLAVEEGAIMVAIGDDDNIEILEKLAFVLNRDIRFAVASRDAIATSILRHYGEDKIEWV